jgi:flagellar basal body P-ring formation protein FlgA
MSANKGAESRQFNASTAAAPAYIGRVKKLLFCLLGRPSDLPHVVRSAICAWVACVGLASPASAQSAAPAVGQMSASDAIAQALPQAVALARQAATVTAPAQARVRAEPGPLDGRLSLAPCGHVEAFLWPGVPSWGHTRVGLQCTVGATRWRVSLPMTVQVWADAVVMRTDLPAGTRLAAEHLTRAEIDWAAQAGSAFDAAALVQGRTLARPLASGQALRAADLQTRQWFARGETVQVQVAGAGFAIVADGEALGPGLEGQLVRVRMASGSGTENNGNNAPGSGRVVVGKPVGERRVEVAL